MERCLVTELGYSIIVVIIIIVSVDVLLRESLLALLYLVRNVLVYMLEVYLLLNLRPFGIKCVLKPLVKVYDGHAWESNTKLLAYLL